MSKSETAARLIAEMISADSWSIPHKLEDHPILGPAISYRDMRYAELKRKMGFTEARIVANTEAIERIMAND